MVAKKLDVGEGLCIPQWKKEISGYRLGEDIQSRPPSSPEKQASTQVCTQSLKQEGMN